ncbi:MAG: acyl-CoA carboxylase subunit beta, partial [Pricia sp.]|nr:acyl-CoA carboxylase subunit beta [Pricia sp.]
MDLKFNKNEDHNKLMVSELKNRIAEIKLGGGKSRIEKQHAQGKMTARERIEYLLDKGKASIEIGALVGAG